MSVSCLLAGAWRLAHARGKVCVYVWALGSMTLVVGAAPVLAQRASADTSSFAAVRALLDTEDPTDLATALDQAEALLPGLLVGRDREASAEALLLLGQAHRARGAYGEALTATERAQLFADQSGTPTMQARAYRDLGEALRGLERYQEAAIHFGAAAQFFEGAGETAAQAAMHRAQSRAYLLAGRSEQARAAAQAGVRVAEEMGLRPEQAEGLRLVAAIAAQQGDYSAAYATLQEAEALQVAQLEARIAAQRTDLEQSLLDALTLREAERARTDDRVRDFIEAEQVRWRRQVAYGIGAFTLAAVGIALLVWGTGIWRRQRHHIAVRRRQRARARERRARGLAPVTPVERTGTPSQETSLASSTAESAARTTSSPVLLSAPAHLGGASAEEADSGAVSPMAISLAEASPADAPALEAGPLLEDVALAPSEPGTAQRDGEADRSTTRPGTPAAPDAAERQRIAAAAAMAPEGLSARHEVPTLASQAEVEETGLALAALLLDQQLGSFSGDGIAVVDRDRVQGRAEVLRMLRHRVLRQGVEVDMQGFGEALRDYVLLRRGSLATGIEIAVEAPVAVRLRHAAPLGLIAYELLINAVEHAFVGRRSGRIDLQVRQDAEHVTLTIADDGRGLPPGFSLERSGGEGLAFVRSLAGYLRAAVEVRSRTGTRWSVHVPLATAVQPTMEAAY